MAADFDVRVDYYEVLQVHPRAEMAVIRSAFRTILRDLQSHPDLGGSHEKAVLINDAYRVLTDDKLRSQYDLERQELLFDKTSKSQAVSIPESEWQYVTCQSCGRRNRIPRLLRGSGATCGACHSELLPRHQHTGTISVSESKINTLRLSKTLYETLQSRGELELRQDTVPRGGEDHLPSLPTDMDSTHALLCTSRLPRVRCNGLEVIPALQVPAVRRGIHLF